MTNHQLKYFATYLKLKHPPIGPEKIGESIINATIDLNPHQVEAALFYFNNPLTKGIILADEVGLGKTIEAGLVLCQLWSEMKRKIILVVPASLRKQWVNELLEKFSIPSIIIDGKIYKEIKNTDDNNPFDQHSIVICSYEFVARHGEEVSLINRDLAVFDEAHKLRNVYKELLKEDEIFSDEVIYENEDEEKKISRAKQLKDIFENNKKLLLTATPLQNSLLEMYGLISYVDEFLFGDLVSFKEQYINGKITDKVYLDLRKRLQSIMHRTLRKQVTAYIKYTDRKAITQEYSWNDKEREFYNKLSEFLQTSELFMMKNGQVNFLLVLIYWKIIGSSFQAIKGTLNGLKARLYSKLQEMIDEGEIEAKTVYVMSPGSIPRLPYENEIDEDIQETYTEEYETETIYEGISAQEAVRIQEDIVKIDGFLAMADNLDEDSKAIALLKGLEVAYQHLEKIGNKKILIFTESRRTQSYLKEFLENNGYDGKILEFNGSNNSPQANEIYKNRADNPENINKLSGSKQIDVRSALVDYFKNTAEIMIATESAAEGINLQFCNLLINYDLPWNPQRVEQRIGRVHRYGQQNDVIVINLLNLSNTAEQRIFQLLNAKLRLFEGMFGASDEILGQLESGVDIEKTILKIYQTCKTKEEIEKAFDELQSKMDSVIKMKMTKTKRKVIDSFDKDVGRRLKDKKQQSEIILSQNKEYLLQLSKHLLRDYIEYDSQNNVFRLNSNNLNIKPGIYGYNQSLIDYRLRTNDVLGQYLIARSNQLDTGNDFIQFDITNNSNKVSVIEKLKGQNGYLKIAKFIIDGYQPEEYLICSCVNENGEVISSEIANKIMDVKAKVIQKGINISDNIENKLKDIEFSEIQYIKEESLKFSENHFNEELDKLDKWANDLRITLEKKLKNLTKQISDKKTLARKTRDTLEQLKIQKSILSMEKKQKTLRNKLYDEENSLENKKEAIINGLEDRMKSNYKQEDLFTIKWEII